MRKQKAKAKGKRAQKVKRFLWALFLLARPVNAILAFFGVVVGALMACEYTCIQCGLLAGLAAALVSAGGQAINDVYDVEVDREKKRPIPRGWISKRWAKVYAAVLFGLGVAVALCVSLLHAFIALLAALLIFLYSYKIQKRKYIGNVLVAFFTGLLFVFGGLCGSRWYVTLIPALLAFLATWSREIWKDIEDMESDRGFKRSLAHILTPKLAAYFAAYLALLAVLFSPLPSPIGFGFLGWSYLYLVLVADAIFLLSAYLGINGNARWAEKGAKLGMIVATLAMLAGALS